LIPLEVGRSPPSCSVDVEENQLRLDALTFYRISHQLWKWHVPFLPRIIDLVGHVLFTASLPHRAAIGEGCAFLHRGMGTLIATECKIGNGVVVGPFVSIGGRVADEAPVIEDDVVIGGHAMILGNITIGKGAVIGANAVVVKDVPPCAIMAGPPAQFVRTTPNGGKEYIASLGAR
jgi:serine O-acetyltransferase